jgi:hypothetical protein
MEGAEKEEEQDVGSERLLVGPLPCWLEKLNCCARESKKAIIYPFNASRKRPSNS